MTPSVNEPATFRFVAQYLNHCATAVPSFQEYRSKITNSYYIIVRVVWIRRLANDRNIINLNPLKGWRLTRLYVNFKSHLTENPVHGHLNPIG